MDNRRIWTIALALSLLLIVWFIGQRLILSHVHNLNISAYIDCLNKYQRAKESGKIPSDPKPPAGSEVCARYK